MGCKVPLIDLLTGIWSATMSRTKHHKTQKHCKCGWDFGARYNHNKGYGGGTGPQAKDAADIERRIEDKKTVQDELKDLDS
jgi:hypothetical protein